MKPSAQTSFAERLGQMLGRMWRGYVRQERKANGWLVERGIPAVGATALLWIIKLVVLGVLLYVAFWLALLLVFAVAAAWAVQHGALDSDREDALIVQDELSKLRQTPGYDPNLYNDTSHEMYKDD
jgi:hypothetical protein